ncbi:MAG: hypothetical protein QM703_09230 [Gemmatales bacterium]
MSRMIAFTLLGLFTVSTLCATDVDKYPPGQKPFHSPKAPVPNGVFAPDACYGFHATRWTPWNQVCSNCTATGAPLTQSCTNSGCGAIIIFDDLPSAPVITQTKPLPGTTTPAPESTNLNKPMPPVRK